MVVARRSASGKGDGLDQRRSRENFDRAVHALFEATVSLHESVLGEQTAAVLDAALDRRETTYQALRAASESGIRPDAASRACLAEIKTLDAEMRTHGMAEVGALRGQRQSVQRRRSAIQAHAKRDRGEPRLVTVKA